MPRKITAKKRAQPGPDETDGELEVAVKKPRLEQPVENINTSGILSLPVEVFELIYENLLDDNVRLITREEVMAREPHLDATYQIGRAHV